MVTGLCGGGHSIFVVQLNLGFAPLEVVSYNAVLGALGAQWTLGDVRFFCGFFLHLTDWHHPVLAFNSSRLLWCFQVFFSFMNKSLRLRHTWVKKAKLILRYRSILEISSRKEVISSDQ